MYVDTQVRPQGEQVDAVAPAKLKLSQAIRIGAKIRPQCYGDYFERGKSCALGAAWEGAGFAGRPPGLMKDLLRRFGINIDGLGLTISQKNDRGESRESIADWLEAQGL